MIATIFQEELDKGGFTSEVTGDRLTIIPLGLALAFEHLHTEGATHNYNRIIGIDKKRPVFIPTFVLRGISVEQALVYKLDVVARILM